MLNDKTSILLRVLRLVVGLRFTLFVIKDLSYIVHYSTLYFDANSDVQRAITHSFLIGIINASVDLVISLLIVFGLIKNKRTVWLLGIIFGIYDLLIGVYAIYLSPKSVLLTHPTLVTSSLFYLLFWNILLIAISFVALNIKRGNR